MTLEFTTAMMYWGLGLVRRPHFMGIPLDLNHSIGLEQLNMCAYLDSAADGSKDGYASSLPSSLLGLAVLSMQLLLHLC